jgi:hypothetical protein
MSTFRHAIVPLLPVVLAGAGGCKPDLGAPPSLIDGPRILTVRALPSDANPGDMVMYEALAVDVGGRVDPADDLGWNLCLEPHPPAESNIVNKACLEGPDSASGSTFAVPLPTDACSLFGPVTPIPKAGQPATRPADPDITGGYYQPIRLVWHRSEGDEVAFTLERIICRLANAAVDTANEFMTRYVANVNPVIDTLTLDPDNNGGTVLFAAGQPAPTAAATVTVGQAVTLEARWPDGSAELFPVYNISSRELEDQHESMRLAWFATGGKFEHDRTGRTDLEFAATDTRNLWTAPETPGTVHMWLVLRDSRGGVDFAEATIEVTS